MIDREGNIIDKDFVFGLDLAEGGDKSMIRVSERKAGGVLEFVKTFEVNSAQEQILRKVMASPENPPIFFRPQRMTRYHPVFIKPSKKLKAYRGKAGSFALRELRRRGLIWRDKRSAAYRSIADQLGKSEIKIFMDEFIPEVDE